MKYKTYKRTKASSVDWLGDVPDHWVEKKLSYGFLRIGSGTTPSSESDVYYGGDVPWVTTSELRENIIVKTKEGVTRSALAAYSALKIYPAGTLLFAMYGATIGRLGILGIPATLNQACCAFASPTLFETRFIYYWLSMRRPILVALALGGGQPNLSQNDLRQIRISTPTLAEQKAIAEYLDDKTEQIDQLVAKKQRLIERLKEKRTALISHVVTRGLPPAAARAAGLNDNPSMKDSGVEWLGEIPEHWEAKRLKYTLRENLKYGANETSELTDPELPRYVRITDIDEDGMLRQETFRSIQIEAARDYYLAEGDVLFARSGATAGKTFLYRSSWGECAYAGYLIRARMDDTILNPHFLRHFTDSVPYWQWISSSIIQATIQNVNAEKYCDLILPIPPMAEQLSIVSFLDQQSKRIHHLRLKVEAAISKLQEYRTALITAAVTGKIDLSDKAVPFS